MNDRDESTGRRPGPFEHIFVATDFSASAARAIARATRLPLANDGRVSIIHVLPEDPSKKRYPELDEGARQKLEQVAAAVSDAFADLGRPDIRVVSELRRGQGYVEIIRHARSEGADLIVLGRHGRRPVRDMFIGSTAKRVIRAGDLPVLVVSRVAHGPYGRPVVAVDLKDTNRSLVHVTLRLVGAGVESIALVHAFQVPFEGFVTPAVRTGESTELRKEYEQQAHAAVRKVLAALADFDVRFEPTTVHGDPRSAILIEAARLDADLLAVGTHARSGISHALVGSVSEWIIEAARCDVLVERPARVSFELP
jgi:nucleotide-binding universal stress UspA family protein